MDWKNGISWTGNRAPVFLFETDDTAWFIWINRSRDSRYSGWFERHFKPAYPMISRSEGYAFGRSYKTQKRLLHYAREFAKRATESGQ